jgi:flagellar biosynthesis/type III secretory pathway chaperone
MAVQPGDVHKHAEALITEEAVLLGKLETLLAQERTVLRGDDATAIENIGATRHDCTAALARLAAERDNSCRLLSFKAGRSGFEELLNWCDLSGALAHRWYGNLDHARRCRDLNDRNGALVAVKLHHVQNMLGALRGEVTDPVYSQQSRPLASFATRELGVA